MSNLPNSIIRLVPPSLRGGYCPDSWQEFANELVCGTQAQHSAARGTTFYNFGNLAHYPPAPTPEPPAPACQDFLIDWEPASNELGEYATFYTDRQISPDTGATSISFDAAQYVDVGFYQPLVVSDTTTLQTIAFPNATIIGMWVEIENNSALTSVTMDSLVTKDEPMIVINNPVLTTFSAPNWLPSGTSQIRFDGNSLDQTSVDGVLARCVANPAKVAGTIRLDGGTNAAPSASGLADKATLVGRGCTVLTN